MAEQLIEVRIWGRRVGAVAADPKAGCYAFEYDPKWVRTGIELAPLLMPVSGGSPPIAVFPTLPEATYKRLPGLLSDALPDDFGNALIDAWMARKGILPSSISALDRLAYMGRRGMGALEFKPSRGSHRESAQPIEMARLVETARVAVHGDFSTDKMAEAALQNIIRVGISAGGARAKAVVAWNPETDEVRSGQFDVAPGFEHWLLKFDIGEDAELGVSQDFGRTEYAYHLMAVAAGIEMAPSRLLQESGRAHFMTKRFDRDDNNKHHVQTLCAMQHLDYKQRATHAYEQLFMAVATLDLGNDAIDQMFARMCFNVAAKNCDDHTKNFAFRLRKGKPWEIAPAYDVTFSHNPKGAWTYQHLMSVNGTFNEISDKDLLVVAERFQVRRPKVIMQRIDEAIAGWRGFAHKAGLSPASDRRIASYHRRLLPSAR